MAGHNRGPELAAVACTLLLFSFLAVCLRFYTILCILKRRLFAEDWLSVFTLVVYTAYTIFGLLSIKHGLGSHVDEVPIPSQEKALKFLWLGQVFYVAVAVLVKFVAGVLLLRICLHERWQRIAIWNMLALLAVFNFAYIFIVIFQCHPVRFYWSRDRFSPSNSEEPGWGDCHSRRLMTIPTYISFLLNVFTDWTLALLPISFVWNAKMDCKDKLSVVGLLAIGVLASIATVARFPYAKHLNSSNDFLYNFTYIALWSTVEIGLGIIASSCATLRPLFRKIKLFPSMISSKSEGSGETSPGFRNSGMLVPQKTTYDPWVQFEFGIETDDRTLALSKDEENGIQEERKEIVKDGGGDVHLMDQKKNYKSSIGVSLVPPGGMGAMGQSIVMEIDNPSVPKSVYCEK
ncbi:hypothetical protein HYFRA_00008680 [Hymenoscyphus fraxineus]|uniref:Rhodopsin domain-containing protein n=1 Tax=Hymenoscyphus fraxineus TaxID=746836 RepID=A0A9N9KXQ5_9HELO|nr:hypothetical protein HYFRA_00008680 [Hymenoscyphus fraxineus]